MTAQPGPLQPIRRFDVFAEYSKLKWMKAGHPLDEAKGYGLWLAKVVASRRYRSSADQKTAGEPGPGDRSGELHPTTDKQERFRSLSDEPQTDVLFDHDIVSRMGSEFYGKIFAPAIADAFAHGHDYVAIRDSIRKNWKNSATSGSQRHTAKTRV